MMESVINVWGRVCKRGKSFLCFGEGPQTYTLYIVLANNYNNMSIFLHTHIV